jgi:hypothetical protein
MSFLKPPSPPDPTATSNAQQGYNTAAAAAQQRTNMINQTNPFGSLTYAGDPNAPGGYSANINLSPAQQAILDQLQNTQLASGQAAQNQAGAAAGLTSNFASLYGQPPNIDPSSLTNKMMGWGQQYMQPIFDQQQSNLDAKLQNQGISSGSQAWDNAQNLQSRNVNNAYQNLFLNAEPNAFSQALQEYQLPMQTAQELQGGAAGAPTPTTPNSAMVQTPQAQIQPPNYTGAVEQNYQQQNAAYGNMMQGLFSIPSALAGGWARGGFAMPK